MTSGRLGDDPAPTDDTAHGPRRTLPFAVRVAVPVAVALGLVAVALSTPTPSRPPDARTSAPPSGAASASLPGRTPGTSAPTPTATETAPATHASGSASPDPPPLGGLYGTSVAADSKANLPVGPWGRISHRFRATTTSAVVSVRFAQRGGPDGYSAGTGGTLGITIERDASGLPSGTPLASASWAPGNPDDDWTGFEAVVLDSPAIVTEGDVYHVVYANLDPDPLANFISVNDLYVYDDPSTARPPGTGADFVTIDQEEGAWDVSGGYTPVLDVAYEDGVHDGQAYVEALVEEPGVVVGPDRMGREAFVVSGGDRPVSSVSVRVRRTRGDSPLAVELASVDGTVLERVAVASDRVLIGEPGDFGDESSERWVTAAFGRTHVLADGVGYVLTLATEPDTEYTTIPLREGTDVGLLSYRFTDGVAEHTLNGGVTWSDLFEEGSADLQFYFE